MNPAGMAEEFEERVAIMMYLGGLSECQAIRAAYSEIRKSFPGIPMPMKIIQDVNRCINQYNRQR